MVTPLNPLPARDVKCVSCAYPTVSCGSCVTSANSCGQTMAEPFGLLPGVSDAGNNAADPINLASKYRCSTDSST